MAAIVLVKLKQEERQREIAVEKARNDARFVKDILKRHNVSNTATLKFEEVRSWLQVVGSAHAGTVTGTGLGNKLIEDNFPGSVKGLAALKSGNAEQVHTKKIHGMFILLRTLNNYQQDGQDTDSAARTGIEEESAGFSVADDEARHFQRPLCLHPPRAFEPPPLPRSNGCS